MDLQGIISISGKPGLFKVIARSKNSIIVESLLDKKRIPAYATDRISALEDISIYTYDEDKPLLEVFESFAVKTKGEKTLGHKEDISVLKDYLSDVLPGYDEERVYPSDIKKLFQWFNILVEAGVIEVKKEEKKAKSEDSVKEKKSTEPKKPATKKKAESKSTEKKPAAKPKAPKAKKEDK